MPKLMEILGYIIYFWSNEGIPTEPIHVHIAKQPNQNGTKIWLKADGSTIIEHNKSRIPSKELKQLTNTIEEFHEQIEERWKEFFKVENVTHIDDKKIVNKTR